MANAKVNTYRLLSGTPNSWALRQHEVGIITPNGGYRFINYFRGSNSIFVDDEVNKNRKPTKIVLEYNDADATEFHAPVGDIILNKFLQAHPDFNVKFELFNEDMASDRILDKFEKREKALEALSLASEEECMAEAISIFGLEALSWSAKMSKARLKDKAFETPDAILDKKKDGNYKSLFVAALAFKSEIVKENNFNSAIVWNDSTEGNIINLESGQNAITKLSDFLASGSMDAKQVLHEIGVRSDKKNGKSGNDAKSKPEGTPVEYEGLDNAGLKALYEKTFDKAVPAPYSKNEDWIKSKLKEYNDSLLQTV